MPDVAVAVLMTLNSKEEEARFVCEALAREGVEPWLVDLSLRPHGIKGASASGGELAEAAGSTWEALEEMDRTRAAEVMISGGVKILREKFLAGGISGAIGVGGANGSSMACALMRSLPPLFPKVMVSPVAATAAVQWYVAESDIAMFPSIGDLSINRITRAVMENAARSVAAMAKARAAGGRPEGPEDPSGGDRPLVGVSSFGGTAGCVDRVTEQLAASGYEVIHFHASGPGGRALESLAEQGELAGVIDVTTHEMADLLVGGEYSAGEGRLRAAGEAGLPQVIVPGALDHANFWVGRVPEKFRDREFFQYNAQILLMRTSAGEFEALGRLMAERLSAARGPFAVLIPRRGFSEHTKRKTHDVEGREAGEWAKPEVDRVFGESLRAHLKEGRVEEFDLHINDADFADACVSAFLEMMAPGA